MAASTSSRGVALLEVLVGSVVVAIAAVGVALMFSTGHALIQGEGENRVAAFLARWRIEQVRAGGFGSLTMPDPREEIIAVELCFTDYRILRSDVSCTAPNRPGYTRTTTIADQCPTDYTILRSSAACASPPPSIEAKLVTVTITPPDARASGELRLQAILVKLQ